MLLNKSNLILSLVISFFLQIDVQASNAITSSSVLYNPTFEHISVHLTIVGDDNLNSTTTIQYRLQNTTTWKPAAPTMRAHPLQKVDGANLGLNFHAGSVLFLNPNTTYEIQTTLTDPDGGSSTIINTVKTNSRPTPPSNPQTIYVVPGNGGGTGTPANPYQGIQTAANNAAPGQIIELATGNYTPFVLDEDGTPNAPIVIKSAELHGAVINGGGTNAGIIQIGNFSDSTQHIILDGLKVINGHRGIDAQNTQYLTVKNCDVYNVDYGFVNRRENGWEHDQYIHNNRFVGKTFWPQAGVIPSERGVDIRGNRNVISYNTITDFGDGVSTDGKAYKTAYALDIHNNDINRIVDDLIEVDGMISNARVYQNRCFNGRAGVSLAPVYGGPAYVFRNELVNIENSGFKMNRAPSGLFLVNNTIVKSDNGLSSTAGWQNTVVKNNAVFASRYCIEEYGLVAGSTDDWDYNGYRSTRPGTLSGPWFKWNNTRYINVFDLQLSSNIEANGRTIATNDVGNLSIPTTYVNEITTTQVDLFPSNNSMMIDGGIPISNINDPFVMDGTPDIGALEAGMPLPDYGHDFSPKITLSIQAILEGGYDIATNLMITELLQKGLLPSGQPYHQPPWSYLGQEGSGWSISDYPTGTVDWVLVSFRTTPDATSVVARTAGVLLEDGTVLFPNQEALSSNAGTAFYIVVEHRNHMAVMSDGPVTVANGTLSYDFRMANSYNSGGTGQREISPGVWVLLGGDGDQLSDTVGFDINGNDISKWQLENGYFNVYSLNDYSLEGDVNGLDRVIWNRNNGTFSAVKK